MSPGRLADGCSSVWAASKHQRSTIGPQTDTTGGRKLVAGLNARITAGGKEIYFTRDEKGAERLRRATLGTNGTVEESEALFPANAEPVVRSFDVSPDGQLLAFTDRRGTDRPNIFVTTLPDLRDRRQVTLERWLTAEVYPGRQVALVHQRPFPRPGRRVVSSMWRRLR